MDRFMARDGLQTQFAAHPNNAYGQRNGGYRTSPAATPSLPPLCLRLEVYSFYQAVFGFGNQPPSPTHSH